MRVFLAIALIIMVMTSGCIATKNPGTSTIPTTSMQKRTTYSTANDTLNPTKTEEVRSLVDANNLFGVVLYRELSNSEGNIFISPFSVFTALSMTYEGARGQTADEMRAVLHLPENASLRRDAFRTLLLYAERPSGAELRVANALWVQKGYPLKEDYLDVIREYYLGEVRELDFKSDPNGAKRIINEWVEEQTKGKIKNLVSGLSRETRLIITNAVYFKANWTLRFNPSDTHNGTFTLSSGRKAIAPMMTRLGKFNYTETDEFQALEMPYSGSRFSMVIILPKRADGLEKIEKELSPKLLEDTLKSLRLEEVEVTIPKFKFESEYHLGRTLQRMGMSEAFTDRADFSGISERPVAISEVVHKTFISVAENGTEAAAATAVILTAASAPGETPKYKVFKADHPFLFFIVDRDNGLILFMGRLVNPRG